MKLSGSSKMRAPFLSKTSSSGAGPSITILYSKPEHPPATILTRSPFPLSFPARSCWIFSAARSVMVISLISNDLLCLACKLRRMFVILNEPPLPHYLVLDPEKPLCQGFRPRGTARNIHVYRNDLVHPFTDRIGELKKPSAVGAAAHRDDILRIRHLIVEQLGPLGHLISQRSGHDHQI